MKSNKSFLVLIIAQTLDENHGGGQAVREMCSALEEIGFEIALATEYRLKNISCTWTNILVPSFWSRTNVIKKLANTKTIFSYAKKNKPSFCLIVGDRPRISYILLQRHTPVIFNRHDGILCCPATTRYQPNSRKVCKLKFGWRCLKVNRVEGCLEHLGVVRRVGRIVMRKRDKALLKALPNRLFNSDYCRRIHGYDTAPFLTPYIYKPLNHKNSTPERQLKSLAFVGRITRVKGSIEVLKVLDRLPSDYTLKVIGDGSGREEMESVARELGLSNRITFLGWLNSSDLFRVLHSCGALLLPSMWDETFGRVGPEAMSLGTPVVAYDVGGISEWCSEPCGKLTPCGSIEDMAHAALEITMNKETWSQYSNEAHEATRNKFNKRQYIHSLTKIIAPFTF